MQAIEMLDEPDRGSKINVATKILKVMQDVSYVQKDGRNRAQKYNYLSEEALVTKVRESMIAHGLIVIPSTVYTDMVFLERTPDHQGNERSPMPLTTVMVEYTIVCTDTGEQVTCRQAGQGTDSMDKGVYKALTGCNKYFLMKLFQIPSGDDPEKETPQDQPDKPMSTDAKAALEAAKTKRFRDAIEGELSKIPEAERREVLMTCLPPGTDPGEWTHIRGTDDRMAFFNKVRAHIDAEKKEKE